MRETSPCLNAGVQDTVLTFGPGRFIRIPAIPYQGSAPEVGAVEFAQPLLLGQNSVLPIHFRLLPNYPNPFNPETNIEFRIPQIRGEADFGLVNLTVFDLQGGEVKTLMRRKLTPGVYQVHWDGTNEGGQKVASGIYLYRLQAGTFFQARKMLLVR